MKIGVMSDTHGDLFAVKGAVNVIGKVDLWLHAGDYSRDSEYLKTLTQAPVIAVRGNCDGQVTAKVDEFVEINGIMIWLTHGHLYGIKHRLDELKYWARQYNAALVIYGHSHVPDIQRDGERLFFNPGSAARPANSYLPTCGLLDISEDKITPSIIEIVL